MSPYIIKSTYLIPTLSMPTTPEISKDQAFEIIFQRMESSSKQPINPTLRKAIKTIGKVIHYKKNEKVNQVGDINQMTYSIVKGSFVATMLQENGKESTVMLYSPSTIEFMSCHDSYFYGTPTKYTLKAVSEACVIATSKNEIEKLRQKNQELSQLYIQQLQRMLVLVMEINNIRQALSSKDLLKLIYQKSPNLFHDFPSKDIADFMGITPVWLSNLKRKYFS